MIKYQPKSNEKYMPLLHFTSSFEGNSCINLKDTATTDLLFLVVFIRRGFYISRCHFSKIFRTSFNIIWKIDFQHEFSIFNKLTLLMLPYYLPTTCFNPKTARGGGNLTPPLVVFRKVYLIKRGRNLGFLWLLILS